MGKEMEQNEKLGFNHYTNLLFHDILFKIICLIGDPEHGDRKGQIQHHLKRKHFIRII